MTLPRPRLRTSLRSTFLVGMLAAIALPVLVGLPNPSRAGAITARPYEVRYALIQVGADRTNAAQAVGELRVRAEVRCSGEVGGPHWQQDERLVLTMSLPDGRRSQLIKELMSLERLDGSLFSFTEVTRLDGTVTDRSRTWARRIGTGLVLVDVEGAEKRSFDVPANTLFPQAHLARLLAAAQAGVPTDSGLVYLGGGEDLLEIASTIAPSDALDRFSGTAQRMLRQGRVFHVRQEGRLPELRVAALPPGQPQSALYRFEMQLHESGVAVELRIDLDQFALRGDLSDGQFLSPAKC